MAKSIATRASGIKQRQKIAYPEPVIKRWPDNIKRTETICYYCKFRAAYIFLRCPQCESEQT